MEPPAENRRVRGLSREFIYAKLAPRHRGLIKKVGHVSMLDLYMLDEIIANSPDAEIKGNAA
jgi:hypothetical protein